MSRTYFIESELSFEADTSGLETELGTKKEELDARTGQIDVMTKEISRLDQGINIELTAHPKCIN